MWQAIVGAIGAANQKESQLRIQKANAKVQSAQAGLNGAVYGMQLEANFNKAMASDVVMAASQHRRGGSVAAIAQAATKQFNWDMDFAEMSTEINMMGLDANLAALDSAQSAAMSEGILNAGISGYTEYQKAQERIDISAPKSLLAPKEDSGYTVYEGGATW